MKEHSYANKRKLRRYKKIKYNKLERKKYSRTLNEANTTAKDRKYTSMRERTRRHNKINGHEKEKKRQGYKTKETWNTQIRQERDREDTTRKRIVEHKKATKGVNVKG